jgi:hypothetical protein
MKLELLSPCSYAQDIERAVDNIVAKRRPKKPPRVRQPKARYVPPPEPQIRALQRHLRNAEVIARVGVVKQEAIAAEFGISQSSVSKLAARAKASQV